VVTADDLYIVEQGGRESDSEATEPMTLRAARSVAFRRMGGRVTWPGAMVRPNLGEVEAWEAESGSWICIRRATLYERECAEQAAG
jgi:hypothetical protein